MSESKPPPKATTTRSNEFIASFQIDAVCGVLRELVLRGIEPGPEVRHIVKRLHDDFVGRATGGPIEHIPDVSDGVSASDLYAIAELIRATNLAFLTPEEIHERAIMVFPVPRTAEIH
jgi:hypothetical protein